MSHLPIILFAVFVSQAYHELGHAFSAALCVASSPFLRLLTLMQRLSYDLIHWPLPHSRIPCCVRGTAH